VLVLAIRNCGGLAMPISLYYLEMRKKIQTEK
jgi:hypothetical protein